MAGGPTGNDRLCDPDGLTLRQPVFRLRTPLVWCCGGFILRGQDVDSASGRGMQIRPPCPQCEESGWLVGRDRKGRELFACRTAICDVVDTTPASSADGKGWPASCPIRGAASGGVPQLTGAVARRHGRRHAGRTVRFDGGDLGSTYPGSLPARAEEDTAYQTECARAEEMLLRDTWYAGYLYRRLAAASIEAWDARDPDGRPTAITAAALYLLPIGGLQRIVREATSPGIHASVSLTVLTTNGASTP